MPRTAALLILALVSLLTAVAAPGCGEARPATPHTREPARVLATTYAMADIVRAVGGNRVRPEWWVERGESLAELAENPARRQQLNSVDLIVTRGQVDPWTMLGAGNTYQDRRILRLDLLPAARDHNPAHHIWLDPAVARDLADELANRLGALDPTHADRFRENAANFKREIDAMVAATEADIARAGGAPFVTIDTAFYPMARRFGLSEVRVPMVNLREPTTYNVNQLRQVANNEGGGAIFASTETPLALLRDWETRLGLPVLALDPLGSSGRAGRSTYLELLRYNLAQLEKGVALSKPRQRAATRSLGAVTTYEPPPFEAPTTTTTEATQPEEPSEPRRSRPSVERQRFSIPSTQPASPLLPFSPASGK